MAVFSIIAFHNPDAVRQAVVEQYGAGHYEFTPSVWFVSDVGSTRNVADRIGLTDGRIGAQGVVLLFDKFSGWGPVSAWNWLGRNTDAVPNG